jgi:hypothetical protein
MNRIGPQQQIKTHSSSSRQQISLNRRDYQRLLLPKETTTRLKKMPLEKSLKRKKNRGKVTISLSQLTLQPHPQILPKRGLRMDSIPKHNSNNNK